MNFNSRRDIPATGSGDGYTESFDITVNSFETGVTGIHMDLFTMVGTGDLSSETDVKEFAPFSHDAEWTGNGGDPEPDPTPMSEPGTLAMFGLGLIGLGVARRRRAA